MNLRTKPKVNRCWCRNEVLILGSRSLEHIIPHGIGGRLTSRDLLCMSCNNEFGQTIDAELCRQVGVIGDALDIKKQGEAKGFSRIEMVSNEGKVKPVERKLKPLFKITYPTPSGKIVTQYIREDKVKSFIAKKQKELEKAGMKTEFIEWVENPDDTRYKLRNNLSERFGDIAFGGWEFMRAVAKIAVNFAIDKGIDKDYLLDVIGFVKGESKHNDYVSWYYPTNYQIHQMEPDEVSHIVYVKGDTEYNMLYAYIEIFSCQNMVILLNTKYEGPEVEYTYAFDLMQVQPIEKAIKIKMVRDHFLHLWLNMDLMRREHINQFNRVERIIERNQLK